VLAPEDINQTAPPARPVAPFIMGTKSPDIFDVLAIELPYHRVETLPFIGFGKHGS
jgi:hypothetical protein